MLKQFSSKGSRAFFTRERCFITEILNDPDVPNISIARCCVVPGVTTELHRLSKTREIYVIETGEGEMDDGTSEPFSVRAGDCVTLPTAHPQRICNTGSVDLIFQVICTPRFVPECYEAL